MKKISSFVVFKLKNNRFNFFLLLSTVFIVRLGVFTAYLSVFFQAYFHTCLSVVFFSPRMLGSWPAEETILSWAPYYIETMLVRTLSSFREIQTNRRINYRKSKSDQCIKHPRNTNSSYSSNRHTFMSHLRQTRKRRAVRPGLLIIKRVVLPLITKSNRFVFNKKIFYLT